MIDAARRPTDSIHPVYFPRIFRRFLEAAANVRRYLICARPPAVPAGWMIDHPGILTQTARLRQSSFPPIRLMTKARMKRASLFLFEELGATEREREETKETDRPDVFINFYGCVLAGEAICAIRGVEGRREGAALLARLKPLLSPVGISVKVEILDPPRAEQLAIILAGVGSRCLLPKGFVMGTRVEQRTRPLRFLHNENPSSTIFPLARYAAPFEERVNSLFGKDRERERGRERGRESLFAHATGVRERKTRCVFFPPSRGRNAEKRFPRCLRNLREPDFVNRTVFRDGRRGEGRSKERDRSGAKIPQGQLIGGGGRLG